MLLLKVQCEWRRTGHCHHARLHNPLHDWRPPREILSIQYLSKLVQHGWCKLLSQLLLRLCAFALFRDG